MHIEYKGTTGGGAPPAHVRVEAEREVAHGWEFEVMVRDTSPASQNLGTPSTQSRGGGANGTRHTVTLSYRDHDLWSGGKMSPSALVEQVVAYVLRRRAEPLPARFDAARVRYWFPEFDKDMRGG
jgi:hypothetical protein